MLNVMSRYTFTEEKRREGTKPVRANRELHIEGQSKKRAGRRNQREGTTRVGTVTLEPML